MSAPGPATGTPHPAVEKADALAAFLRQYLGHPAPLAWEAEQLARKVREHFGGP